MTYKRAVYPAKQAQIEVVNADLTPLEKGEILVKNTYASSNPIDWKVQKYGVFIDNFPSVLGSDFTGVVEQVGEGVTRLKKGDRVFGWSPVYMRGGKPSYGTFQEYTTTTADTTGLTPSHVSDEVAITFCLPIITSMSGLYYSLGLERPPLSRDLVGTKDEYVWINAGSSAVGAAAVQLAVLSGYKVLTTASPKNFDLVKSLGATEVFDYNDPALVEKVQKFLNGKTIRYAYDADSRVTSITQAVEILNGSGNLALVLSKVDGIDYKDVKVDDNHTWRSFTNAEHYGWWFPWIESALDKGLLKPLRIEVIGQGAEGTQALLDHHASGKVSASKPVIKF